MWPAFLLMDRWWSTWNPLHPSLRPWGQSFISSSVAQRPAASSMSPTQVCWMNLHYYSYYITAWFTSWTCLGPGKVCNYCLSWWEDPGHYYLFLQKQLELFRNSSSTCIRNHPNTPASLAASLGGLNISSSVPPCSPPGCAWGRLSLQKILLYTVILIFKTFLVDTMKSLPRELPSTWSWKIHSLTPSCLGPTLPQSDSGLQRDQTLLLCFSNPFRINLLIFE